MAVAALLGSAVASTAAADQLVESCALDAGTAYIRVNGTSGDDVIVRRSTACGDVVVMRIACGALDIGMIPPSRASGVILVIDAGAGNDTIDTTGLAASSPPEIYGGDGHLICCGPSADPVIAGGGDDVIRGGDGGDALFGGAGRHDCLRGGAGDDTLADEDGVLIADGGEGDDSIGVVFGSAWDNNEWTGDVRSSAGCIRGGAGNDYVMITVVDAPLFLSVNGDGGGVLPGPFDPIEVAVRWRPDRASRTSSWQQRRREPLRRRRLIPKASPHDTRLHGRAWQPSAHPSM